MNQKISKLKIKITGASGYLGKSVSNLLSERGHFVSGIRREILYGPNKNLQAELSGCDVVIHLAGASVFQRWTKKNQKQILGSRSVTTQNLVDAINSLPAEFQPKKFISASAVGIYKTGAFHNEDSINFDEGFLGTVAKNWEKPISELPLHTKKIIFRIGVVIGKKAKSISGLLLPFKLGLGARIGNGKQPFPFVHEYDLTHAFCWAVEEYNENNTFNLVAPEPANNKTFTKALASQLNRPAIFVVPVFILKLVLGESAVLLTESPEVSSEKIINAGFQFKYPDIHSALNEILG